MTAALAIDLGGTKIEGIVLDKDGVERDHIFLDAGSSANAGRARIASSSSSSSMPGWPRARTCCTASCITA